jgi:hypothetical protein
MWVLGILFNTGTRPACSTAAVVTPCRHHARPHGYVHLDASSHCMQLSHTHIYTYTLWIPGSVWEAYRNRGSFTFTFPHTRNTYTHLGPLQCFGFVVEDLARDLRKVCATSVVSRIDDATKEMVRPPSCDRCARACLHGCMRLTPTSPFLADGGGSWRLQGPSARLLGGRVPHSPNLVRCVSCGDRRGK